MSDSFLRDLLEQLGENRKFPKFQYERRIDAFISFFLPAVLKTRYDFESSCRIPEFPVRSVRAKGRLCENIDFWLFDETARSLFLVELKTDRGSVKPRQLEYYNRVLVAPWSELRSNLEELQSASKQKAKYQRTLDEFQRCGEPLKRTAVLLAPPAAEKPFEKALRQQADKSKTDSIRQSWHFLSIMDFARAPISTPHPTEWRIFADHLLGNHPEG